MSEFEYFEYHKDHLYKLLIHCKYNVEYYKRNKEYVLPSLDDFTYDFFRTHIPILEKGVLRRNSKQLLSDNVSSDRLSIDVTSGTEGKPIICYRSKEERFVCSEILWKFRRTLISDLKPSDKFARFYAYRNREKAIVSDKILYRDNNILLPLYNISKNKLKEYWNAILEFRPRWMHGPSSTIYALALTVEEESLPVFPIEFIELSGEYVQSEHLAYIKKIFQGTIANQYGTREYWPIAYTDRNGKMKVSSSVFLEQVFDEQNQKNELVLTTLANDVWPLYRYRLGDLGEMEFRNTEAFVNIRTGRKADFFTIKGNKRFNVIIFSGVARAVCEQNGSNVIQQFQVIKEREDCLRVLLRMDRGNKMPQIKYQYLNELYKIIDRDIEINIEEVDFIKPDNRTGKAKEFIDLKER